MLGKGTVSAEELSQQLGDRFAAAVPLAAKAMGVTVKELRKMMEQGQLMTKDFLPKFTKEVERMTGSIDSSHTSMFQFNRMFNEFQRFGNEIWKGGLKDALTSFAKIFADILPDMKPIATFLGVTLKAAITGLTFPIIFLSSAFADLVQLGQLLNKWLRDTFGDKAIDRLGLYVQALWELVVAAGSLFLVIKGISRLMKMFGFLKDAAGDVLGAGKGDKSDKTSGGKSGGKGLGKLLGVGSMVAGAGITAGVATEALGDDEKRVVKNLQSGGISNLIFGEVVNKWKEFFTRPDTTPNENLAPRMNRNINQSVDPQSNIKVNVEVAPNSGEFAKAIDVRVSNNNSFLTQTMLNEAYN